MKTELVSSRISSGSTDRLTILTEAYNAYTSMKSTIINYASVEEALATEDWFGEESKDVRYG